MKNKDLFDLIAGRWGGEGKNRVFTSASVQLVGYWILTSCQPLRSLTSGLPLCNNRHSLLFSFFFLMCAALMPVGFFMYCFICQYILTKFCHCLIVVLWLARTCDECTWHRKTFPMQYYIETWQWRTACIALFVNTFYPDFAAVVVVIVAVYLWSAWTCDECTWHDKTFLVQWYYIDTWQWSCTATYCL